MNASPTLAGLIGLAWPALAAAETGQALKLPESIEFLLEDHCWKCHEDGNSKGDVRLDNLGELRLQDRLELLNRAQEQVYSLYI